MDELSLDLFTDQVSSLGDELLGHEDLNLPPESRTFNVEHDQIESHPSSGRRSRLMPNFFTRSEPAVGTQTEIEINRQNYRIPERYLEQGYRVYNSTKATTSTALEYGIKLLPPPDSGKPYLWKCLFPECFDRVDFVLKIAKTSTANATGHLLTRHGIRSKKAIAMQKNQAKRRSSQMSTERLLARDPRRFHGLLLAKLVALRSLPLAVSSYPEIQQLCGSGSYRPEYLKKCLLDLYCYIKKKLVDDIKVSKVHFQGPFLHVCADLYLSSGLNVKFLGVRVAFTCPSFSSKSKQMRSYNLAVRAFKPNYRDLRDTRLSKLLQGWLFSVFDEFGISESDVLTVTSDSGSDIKRLFEVLMKSTREWCLPHLVHRAVLEAFSDKSVEKITQCVKKIIDFVRHSPRAKTKLSEDQLAKFGETIRLVKFAKQRWSSAYFMYRGLLRNFEILHSLYLNELRRSWPIHVSRFVVEEISSVLKLVSQTVKYTQYADAMCISPLGALWKFYMELPPKTKLLIIDPATEKTTEERKFEELQQPTRTVLIKLKQGLRRRFFDRYNPFTSLRTSYRQEFYVKKTSAVDNRELSSFYRFSYLFDLCWILIPEYRSGEFIRNIIEAEVETLTAEQREQIPKGWSNEHLVQTHFNNISKLMWHHVKDLAHHYSVAETEDSTPRGGEAECFSSSDVPGRKFANPGFFDTTKYYSRKRSTNIASNSSSPHTMANQVQREIDLYLSDSTIDFVTPEQSWSFWRTEASGNRFPTLAKIALAFLSTQSSSAALERDFSPAEDIVTRKRCRLDSWLLEVILAIKLNQRLLPDDLSKIQPISTKMAKSLQETLKVKELGADFDLLNDVVLRANYEDQNENEITYEVEDLDDFSLPDIDLPMGSPSSPCNRDDLISFGSVDENDSLPQVLTRNSTISLKEWSPKATGVVPRKYNLRRRTPPKPYPRRNKKKKSEHK